MPTTRALLASCGRPVSYYSDRYSVFRVNRNGGEGELTQFGRALRTPDIAAIHAHSPALPDAGSRPQVHAPHVDATVFQFPRDRQSRRPVRPLRPAETTPRNYRQLPHPL